MTKPKATAPARKTTRTATAKKRAVTKARKTAVKAQKVDYYPNRMTFWVSAAAGSILILIAVIVAYNK